MKYFLNITIFICETLISYLKNYICFFHAVLFFTDLAVTDYTNEAKNIVDGNRDRTLFLLWQILYGFELKMVRTYVVIKLIEILKCVPIIDIGNITPLLLKFYMAYLILQS